MASRYFGINRGAQEPSVTEGAATTSKSLEVVVNLASNMTKSELFDALDAIRNYIIKSNYPAS